AIGEPYVLIKPVEMYQRVNKALSGVWLESLPSLLFHHASDLARFSLGPPAAILAVVGMWLLYRRGERVLLGVLAAAFVTVILERYRLLRYHVFVVPFLAIAAAHA